MDRHWEIEPLSLPLANHEAIHVVSGFLVGLKLEGIWIDEGALPLWPDYLYRGLHYR